MILVLASVVDEAARAFAQELARVTPASMLTCRDLAEQPIALRYPDFPASTLTVDGRTLAVGRIHGVINLLPAVFPDELFFYPPEERDYQAAEFHALLTFLLSALACPIVNRPTPAALSGPYASSIAWHHFAKRTRIPVASMELDTDSFNDFFPRPRTENIFEVSCLGGRIIENSATAADRITLDLARRANVEHLRAVYEDDAMGPRFVTASAVPNIGNAATRAALIGFFEQTAGLA
jgi:hypothetical protein